VRGLPKFDDPNLIVGAESFSDAGVYRLRDDLYVVQTVDFFPPLVDDPYVFGQIAAANALSDAYAMGAQPVTALNIVAFPDDRLPLSLLQQILAGGAERVMAAGAVIAGGHSVRDAEVKYGLSVTATVAPGDLRTNAGAQAGDVLVLTKALGTGFVTTAFKARKCPDDVLAAAVASMIQLNAIGHSATRDCDVHAVTDVTGFGLAGHAGEVAVNSNVTIEIDVSKLPILPGAAELLKRNCKTRASRSNREFASHSMRIEDGVDAALLEFAFDPQTSGGLLVAAAPEDAHRIVTAAQAAGAAAAAVIGRVKPKQDVHLVLRR
jgi:selenide,water dikinase